MKSHKALYVKVFESNLEVSELFVFRAPVGQVYSEDGIKLVLFNLVQSLKEEFPGNDFKTVKLRSNRFNVMPYQGNA